MAFCLLKISFYSIQNYYRIKYITCFKKMIKKYTVSNQNIKDSLNSFILDWKKSDNKVFKFTSTISGANEIRDFYNIFFSKVGKFLNFAEDGKEKDRSKGRTGETWFEVRNDSSIKNAYRHSTMAQPLHTDGSYIPGYSATVMACVSNASIGGETVFMNIENILNDLKLNDLELYNFVTSENVIHDRSGDTRTNKIFYYEKDILRANFNYYCVSKANSNKTIKYSKKLFEYLITLEKKKKINLPLSAIKLNTGEAIIWKDDQVNHGRHSFIAKKDSERFLWKASYQPNF